MQRQNPTITEKNAILMENRCYSSTVADILTFWGYYCSTLHEKRCAYRMERQNPTITEKNVILTEIRFYSSSVADILTF
jgi:hypothetical protein